MVGRVPVCPSLPLLEELSYIPKEKYSYGPEIFEYCRRIGRHFDLYKDVLFSTIIRSLKWDEAIKRWRVATNRGDGPRPDEQGKTSGNSGHTDI
jgi:cyclohexanone monooxygenase